MAPLLSRQFAPACQKLKKGGVTNHIALIPGEKGHGRRNFLKGSRLCHTGPTERVKAAIVQESVMFVELDAKNQGEVSQILEQIQGGDRFAEQRLVNLLYADLRKMAAHQLKSERSGHTLQPTALVHEAYFRIFTGTPLQVHTRAHFMALAA